MYLEESYKCLEGPFLANETSSPKNILIKFFIRTFFSTDCSSLTGEINHRVADVIHLNADTFTDKVKEKDTLWFVRFCVPWCKHCKKIDSLWDEFGKAVEGEDSVEIAQKNMKNTQDPGMLNP
ncbi:hypothetical protein SUGI_0504120 [Cryptomeria japonica]|nr:hypothetical protein SUGI_0504120 [Cryptomeria japonica]